MMRIRFCSGKSDACRPAIFIDRDGVINCRRANDYVLEWRQFVFMPGIREALRDLSTLRLPMIVISNQAAIGKGLLKRAVLKEITTRLHETLLVDSIVLSAYYYCPHRIDEGCDCRKPRSEMLRRAAADFNVDLRRSIFIGDSATDVLAARSAGCRAVMFGPGYNSQVDSLNWMASIPVALTAKELFSVAVRCLQAAEEGSGGQRKENLTESMAR